MICENCKVSVPEGAAFCPKCGSPIGTPVPPAPNQSKPGLAGKQKGLIAGGVVLVLLLLIGAVFLLFGAGSTKAAVVDDGSTAKKHLVKVTNSISGLDTETGTKIPLQVTGQDANGMDYDFRYYVDSEGMMLPEGAYTVKVAASPIAQDGTIYDVSGAETEAKVDANGFDREGGLDISLEACDSSKVTDEQLNAAYEAAMGGGAKDAETAESLKSIATQKRDEAVAAAEAARKEAQEKAAAEAAEKKQAAIDAAKESGLNLYEGTVRVFDSSEALAEFQGQPNPNLGYDRTYTVLVLSSSQSLMARSSGDAGAMRTHTASMIAIDPAFSKYEGQTIMIGIDPEQTWWPSDTRLPLGEPSADYAKYIATV